MRSGCSEGQGRAKWGNVREMVRDQGGWVVVGKGCVCAWCIQFVKEVMAQGRTQWGMRGMKVSDGA